MIADIAVPIQALRIPRLRHDRVRANEPPHHRIIPACAIIQQPRSAVPPLPREVEGRRRRARRVTRRAVGIVPDLGVGVQPIPRAVQRQRDRAQVIAQQVVERAAAALRHAHGTGVIILLDRPVVYFVVVADEDAHDASDGLLDPVTVAVIDVARRDAVGYAGQPVLGVVGQGVGHTANRAHGHVAIAAVAVGVAAASLLHRMRLGRPRARAAIPRRWRTIHVTPHTCFAHRNAFCVSIVD